MPTTALQKVQETQLVEILGRPLRPVGGSEDAKAIDQLSGMIDTVEDDPAALFVVLTCMHNLAIFSGDIDHTFEATDGLTLKFLAEGAAPAISDLHSLSSTAKDERSLTKLVQRLEDAYDKGGIKPADAAAMLTEIEDRRSIINQLVKSELLTDAIADARHDFEKPVATQVPDGTAYTDTPEGNRKAGLTIFAYGQNLDAALPFFARSNDPDLKQIAVGERGDIGESSTAATLGDAWWQIAKKEAADQRISEAAKRRAATIYEANLPAATGLAKVKFRQRIDEVSKLTPPPPPIDVSNLIGANNSPITIAPTKRVVFVVDRSGSMLGEKTIEAERKLMDAIKALGPTDRFDVILTSEDRCSAVFPTGVRPASSEAVNFLKQSLTESTIGGGGSPWNAVQMAIGWRPTEVVIITDGDISDTVDPKKLRGILGHAQLKLLGVGSDQDLQILQSLLDSAGPPQKK